MYSVMRRWAAITNAPINIAGPDSLEHHGIQADAGLLLQISAKDLCSYHRYYSYRQIFTLTLNAYSG